MSCRLQQFEGSADHARKALVHAVVALDRARGNVHADDRSAARHAWQGFVAGRLSLVEHVDTDGKRFLVVRKTDPSTLKPSGVSLRERQVLAARARGLSLKVIAHELGLSTASVSKSIGNGMAKLGLSCEAELVALFSSATAESSVVPATTTVRP
jgi:DNA-binding NarL/FixJ family response regulator